MDASLRDGKSYEFGSFIMDPAHRVLTHQGSEVALSPTLFEALLFLVEHSGRVVSKEELLDAVWPSKFVADANVSQTIFTLRKALAEAGAREPLIATAPRRGYRFTGPVRVRTHMITRTAGAAPVEDSPLGSLLGGQPSQPSSRIPRVSWRTAVLSAAVLLAILGGFVALRLRGAGHAPPAASVVALADFQNSTGDPIFDRTLDKALRIDLEQSPFVTVLSQRQVGDTLTQMTRASDAPLTTALAEEVCVRNNGQAAIEGSIARLGERYLLTLTATDCSSDHVLAAEKAQIASREAVIPALDRLIGRIRQRLGESGESVAKFNVPIMNEKTASLAAIKAYSEGSYLENHGRDDEAMALFQHAVELDPNFAAAYNAISAINSNLRQDDAAKLNITKAYNLRSSVNEELNLNISMLYNVYVTNNYSEIIRIGRIMTEIYPRQSSAWINLGNAESWLGQYPSAVEAGERGVALAPGRALSYVVLARALMHAGRLDEAAAVLARSAAKGFVGGEAPGLTMQISIARGDSAAVEQAIAAANGKPYESDVLQLAATNAYRQGQVRRGDEFYQRAAAILASQGMTDYALASHALDLARLGLADQARALLASRPANADPIGNANAILAFATIGDAARARALLDGEHRERPADTLLNAMFAPELRAVLALRQDRPLEAVADLQPALAYEARDYDVPYLRGRAYLAAKDGAHAAAEFHKILDHPGVLPEDEQRSLAQLGLARANALQHDTAASRKAYEQFFADWKDADPDLPPLRDARAEYARALPARKPGERFKVRPYVR